jgi:hypothetical protein
MVKKVFQFFLKIAVFILYYKLWLYPQVITINNIYTRRLYTQVIHAGYTLRLYTQVISTGYIHRLYPHVIVTCYSHMLYSQVILTGYKLWLQL